MWLSTRKIPSAGLFQSASTGHLRQAALAQESGGLRSIVAGVVVRSGMK